MNSLSFYLSEKVLISLFLKKRVFFSFSTFNLSCHSLLAHKVSAEKHVDNLRKRPCACYIAFLLLPSGFSLCLWLARISLSVSWCVGLFVFILVDVCWASWTCMSISILRFEKILASMSSNKFSFPLSIFFFWYSHNVYIDSFGGVS